MKKLLVANRGEIAVRILRAASDARISAVAVYSKDDEESLHVRLAPEAHLLEGAGAAAYLDPDAVVAAALRHGCDALHPGYGLLSESAALAQACEAAGVTFVGPSVKVLEQFGDKAAGRELAMAVGVAVVPGTSGPTSLKETQAFFASLAPGTAVVIKALAGGGGRGMRVVRDAADLEDAWTRCRSEAQASFGNPDVLVEAFIETARHVEVQIVGDAHGQVTHLGERECTLQRRHQKVIEVAPSPHLDEATREAMIGDAVRLAEHVGYRSLGTFEFLLDRATGSYYFIEANPRIQVEHTVTELVHDVDLVRTQFRIADGAALAELDLPSGFTPRGVALQARVCAETLAVDGSVTSAGGTLSRFGPPTGPSVRVDSHAYQGYAINPRFDSLLAKVIVQTRDGGYEGALRLAARALEEFDLAGVESNLSLLAALVLDDRVVTDDISTRFIENHLDELIDAANLIARGWEERQRQPGADDAPAVVAEAVDLAGHEVVKASTLGTVVDVMIAVGDPVRAGQPVVVLEAMKMEHVITASVSGYIESVWPEKGWTVAAQQPLVRIALADVEEQADAPDEGAVSGDRPDVLAVLERHQRILDSARPEAVAKRHALGKRTARENVADLCDSDSFVEYGPLVVAAQRRRRTMEDLIANTPADGLIAGIGTVNASMEGPGSATNDRRCVVMSYDYTVLAGTQGLNNHLKMDRMIHVAERGGMPVVLFSEGGGGRPGDVDRVKVAGFDGLTFMNLAKLSGTVPIVGINSGRCFAGNAALLGCCDVIIATKDSNIGMGGPAMVEGGGLGIVRPEDIGPIDVQGPNGVVDIVVEDEAEAVKVARKYLSYAQGVVTEWTAAEQQELRDLIPLNRLRVYDIRSVLSAVADVDSVLELRAEYGLGLITAFARIEGKPVGIVANNPAHLAGAVDSPAADKAARFMQLCESYRIPLLFLCDTPGIMVGPEAEKDATVRHAARMFVVGAHLTVPFGTIVLRKCYGLGAMLMMGGSAVAPDFIISWPTGEFGPMGLEGQVRLGFRRELDAIADPEERARRTQEMIDEAYVNGGALNAATHFEMDDVIDPAESRRWISQLLTVAPEAPGTAARGYVDTW